MIVFLQVVNLNQQFCIYGNFYLNKYVVFQSSLFQAFLEQYLMTLYNYRKRSRSRSRTRDRRSRSRDRHREKRDKEREKDKHKDHDSDKIREKHTKRE